MNLFMTSKLDCFLEHTYFPETRDLLFEEKKLNVARILVGLVIFWRTAKVAFAAYFYYPTDLSILGIQCSYEAVFALFECVLAILLIVGAFTPLILASIILTYPFFDKSLSIATLGTDVLIFFLFGMFWINFRSRYSFDSWAEKQKETNSLRYLVKQTYQILGEPDSKRIRRVYFLCFLCYAMVSFGAMLHHLNDPHWIGGHTLSVLLTNSYLCKYYAFFQNIEVSWPNLFFLFSVSSIIAQTIFQFAMIPCLFWRWSTAFVIVHGLIFFLISAVCLQLSYLPFIELILWGVIFWSSSLHSWALPRRRVILVTQSPSVEPQRHALLIHETYLWLTSFLFLLSITNFPIINHYTSGFNHPKNKHLAHIGLTMPCVFNKADLEMGNRWTTIYRNTDGVRTIVPFHGNDGDRLWYLKFDILYFGNSLAWRRWSIQKPIGDIVSVDSKFVDLVKKVIYFDSRLFPPKENTFYEVLVYENSASDVSLPLSERFAKKMIGNFTFTREPINKKWHYVAGSREPTTWQ